MVESNGTGRPEVSVLVPVYNVEQYLAECLDSVLQQPGVDLEVVCIDDCGTDRSIEILEEYRQRDRRIRVVSHSENRGLSAARNTGIENSEGEYVVLLDSDDLLNPDCLALQVAAIRRDQADMVYFHTTLLWERFPGDPSPSLSSSPQEFVLFNQELRRTNLLNYPALLHATSSWSYIYSRQFLQRHNIRYDEHLKRWEDRAFWTRVARLADSVSIVPVAVRKYRQGSQSITKTAQDPEHLWMMLRQLNIVLDEFELFKSEHRESDTRVHTKYLHSYVAFRVTSWFLNAVKKLKETESQEVLIEGAVELFGRLDWSNVDLHSVKNFTRRLDIDVEKTALLSGLLRNGKVHQVRQFFEVPRLPLQELLEAEESFDGKYPLSRKRFEKPAPEAPSSDLEFDRAAPEPWMDDINVVIHIGFRKTGTTYIQRAFDLNRKRLLREGVLFPDTGLDRTDSRGGRPGALAGHLKFIELVRHRGEKWGLWKDVLREIGKNKVNTIFLSAENFLHEYQSMDLEELRQTFSGFKQLSFIVSLRRPDQWIESLYKELVCGGWRGEARDFDSFIKENWHQMDFAERLEPWIGEFGIEAFDAIPIDSHTDEVDGVRAVLRILHQRTGAGPEPDSVSRWRKPSDEEAYPSPKAELVEAIRLLNTTKRPSEAYRREVSWLIQKWNDTDGLYDATLMDPEIRAGIQTKMGPGYANLLARFGIEDAPADSARHTGSASPNSPLSLPPKVSSTLMEDVMRVARKLPSQDPVQSFFRRFYNQGMPKAPKAALPRVSVIERLVAALILKPILAVWNNASRDKKEALRQRLKGAFGDVYVNRIVDLARRANPGR
ncbi:MAG: glycosyltransferase family 2 protein [Bacteroidetes bacterium]|nr:glycosyltransferase family 2 protein [Bacteroidota bacterium]